MSGNIRRRIARLCCRVLVSTLPAAQREWGEAIRQETDDIPEDGQALRFAVDSLPGLLLRAVAARVLHPLSPVLGTAIFEGGQSPMTLHAAAARRPRLIGIACAVGAVALGLPHLILAGAPTLYLILNMAALAIGLVLMAALVRTPLPSDARWAGAAIIGMAGAMLATALMGDGVDGAVRWVALGSLSIQPSLVLLPLMIVVFVRRRDGLAAVGLVVTAAALAIQPDRAMAGMLAAGLTLLAILRTDRPTLIALGASLAAFAATLSQPDMLPAVPYVDKIIYSAFDVHPLAGIAVLAGCMLLLVPAIVGWRADPASRDVYAVFGIVWLAAIAAAALGNYPTPLVGYGGSAILGYALSLLGLPRRTGTVIEPGSNAGKMPPQGPSEHRFRIGLA